MYEQYWGLSETPFPSALDARTFYASPTHEEALARLHFLVAGRRRLGVLLGDRGSGKSLILEVFAGELRRRGCRVAKLGALGLEASEFLAALATAWDLNPERHWTERQLWAALVDRLVEYHYERVAAIVLVDDADEAATDVLTQLARLAQHQVSTRLFSSQPGAGEARLTIVLTACRDRMRQLSRRLLELADLRIDLQRWESADTQTFVQRALARVGRTAAAFEPDALARLHELCEGNPRRVQQMAELALVAGAGQKLTLIDVHTVDCVYEELAVPEIAGR